MKKFKRNKIIITIELLIFIILSIILGIFINENLNNNNNSIKKDTAIITPFEGYWIGNNKTNQGFIAIQNNIIDYYTNDYVNGFIDVNTTFTYTNKELTISEYKTTNFTIDKQIINYNFNEEGKLVFDNGFTFTKVDKDEFYKYLKNYKEINNLN